MYPPENGGNHPPFSLWCTFPLTCARIPIWGFFPPTPPPPPPPPIIWEFYLLCSHRVCHRAVFQSKRRRRREKTSKAAREEKSAVAYQLQGVTHFHALPSPSFFLLFGVVYGLTRRNGSSSRRRSVTLPDRYGLVHFPHESCILHVVQHTTV